MSKLLSKIKNLFKSKEKKAYILDYTTEINTVQLALLPDITSGADWGTYGVHMDNIGETIRAEFFTSPRINTKKDIKITFILMNGNNGATTADGELTLREINTDGGVGNVVIDNAINFDFVFTQSFGRRHAHHVVSAGDFNLDKTYEITWESQENFEVIMTSIQVEYTQRR